LNFAQVVLINANRLWLDASLEHKQRLQEVLFPEGLTYSEQDGFGTPKTCFAFSWLQEIDPADQGMASPAGPLPFTVHGSALRARRAKGPIEIAVLTAAGMSVNLLQRGVTHEVETLD
jgi:hypothetical protein